MGEKLMKNLISIDRAKELFTIGHNGLEFRYSNRKVGCLSKDGYMVVTVDGRQYPQHRIVWFLVTGSWPINQIDHINGNRADNSVANLRQATGSQNQENRKCSNKSGFFGVTFNKKASTWQAQIKKNGKQFYLGVFNTAELAHFAYVSAKRKTHAFNPEIRIAP